jgi:site-specific DNA-methyltransferase (adenine-specific)
MGDVNHSPGPLDSRDVIYCKSCESMLEVSDDSIDLIISGPPYWDYIDYEQCAEEGRKVGTWSGGTSYELFLALMERWYAECYRVLRPGRYCIVNLGTVPRDGQVVPLPFDAVPLMRSLGWMFQYDIVWHKVSGGRQNARVTVRHPYPGLYRPNERTEHLLVFRKNPNVAFYKRGADRTQGSFPINDFFKREIANNVWHIQPALHDPITNHPCPFPPEIPLRLIRLFSMPGETVLDPFMGVGTTARAAKMLSRHFVGYEKVPSFVNRAYELADKPLKIPRGIVCRYESSDENREWYHI